MSRVKHLFAVVLAALMLCLLMPVAAFAEEASDGKMIVYAKLPSDWSDPHLWAWADDGTNAFDAYPCFVTVFNSFCPKSSFFRSFAICTSTVRV